MLAEDVAHQLFDEILQRDEAGGHPGVVDDDGDLVALALHLFQEVDDAHRRGDEVGGAHDGIEAEGARLPGPRHEILDVDVPDHALDPAVEDRHARVPALAHDLADLRERGVAREGDDLAARHHHVGHGELGEVERARDDLARERVHRSGLGGALDELLELLRGEARFGEGGPIAEEPEHDVGAHRQEPDEGPREPGEREQRLAHQERVLLGVAQGERLGDELAEDDGEVGDQRDDDGERERLGVRGERGDLLQHRAEARGEGGAAEGAGDGADDGDADLHGGEEALGIGAQPLHGAGALALRGDQGVEARPAQRDDGDLGAGEDAAHQGQREDDRELGENGALLSRRPSL